MKNNFSQFLLTFIIFICSINITLSFLDNSYLLKPRNQVKALTFLPGVLDLRGVKSAVLGTEAIVDPHDIVSYVNLERKKINISELTVSPLLEQAAKMRALVILKYQNPSHQDPFEKIQLDTVLPQVGYSFVYATENIALASGNSAGFVAGWMNSPSHRKNLLDPVLKETGVGVTYGKVGDYYVTIAVQLFAVPTQPEKFRGYNESDITNTSNLLNSINAEIGRTNIFLVQYKESSYYSEWKKILTRQKEILGELLTLMNKGLPYEEKHYQLMAEYNNNWSLVPK